jgi:hypothetical protein
MFGDGIKKNVFKNRDNKKVDELIDIRVMWLINLN